jgi:hypothetical protein
VSHSQPNSFQAKSPTLARIGIPLGNMGAELGVASFNKATSLCKVSMLNSGCTRTNTGCQSRALTRRPWPPFCHPQCGSSWHCKSPPYPASVAVVHGQTEASSLQTQRKMTSSCVCVWLYGSAGAGSRRQSNADEMVATRKRRNTSSTKACVFRDIVAAFLSEFDPLSSHP